MDGDIIKEGVLTVAFTIKIVKQSPVDYLDNCLITLEIRKSIWNFKYVNY